MMDTGGPLQMLWGVSVWWHLCDPAFLEGGTVSLLGVQVACLALSCLTREKMSEGRWASLKCRSESVLIMHGSMIDVDTAALEEFVT